MALSRRVVYPTTCDRKEVAAVAKSRSAAPAKPKTPREQLLAKLRSVPADTYKSLAKFVLERAYETGATSDKTLLRNIVDYEAGQRPFPPYGIGDASHHGHWHRAVDALERLLDAYPELTVLQTVKMVADRHDERFSPDNVRFVECVEWMLDGKSPHVGRQLVFAMSNGEYALGKLIAEEYIGRQLKGWHVRWGETEMTYLADCFQGFPGSGTVAVISEVTVVQFRRHFADHLEARLTNPVSDRFLHLLLVDGLDPDAIIMSLRSMLPLNLPLHPALFASCRRLAEQNYGTAMAGYLCYRIFGHWPDTEAVLQA